MPGFRPIRPAIRQWPVFEAQPFDPRSGTFIPARSVGTEQVNTISSQRVQVIGLKAYRSTAQTATTGVDANITYDMVVFREGIANPGATFTTFTVSKSGIWLLEAVVEWANNSTGGRWLYIVVNGTKVEGDRRTPSGTTRTMVTAVRRLAAGDTVGTIVNQTSGGNLDTNTGENNNSLSAVYLGAI